MQRRYLVTLHLLIDADTAQTATQIAFEATRDLSVTPAKYRYGIRHFSLAPPILHDLLPTRGSHPELPAGDLE